MNSILDAGARDPGGSSEGFDRALASFAETYADQNERDYRALHEAIASGRVVAETAF
jgi:hypothetical protein